MTEFFVFRKMAVDSKSGRPYNPDIAEAALRNAAANEALTGAKATV